jgi:hypothetical protein
LIPGRKILVSDILKEVYRYWGMYSAATRAVCILCILQKNTLPHRNEWGEI